MIRVLGLDVSLNHAGVVELDERGAVTWFQFVSDKAGAADRAAGVHLGKPSVEDSDQYDIERLRWWDAYLRQLFESRALDAVGVEGYALMKQAGAAQVIEVGGLARLAAARRVGSDCVCLPDPPSVKLFATGRGNATGAEVAQAVRTEVGDLFTACNPPARRGARPQALIEEDLAAAYTVARLVWTEIELRAGRLSLEALPEHQRRVFLRVTRSNPTNVLARERLIAVAGGRKARDVVQPPTGGPHLF